MSQQQTTISALPWNGPRNPDGSVAPCQTASVAASVTPVVTIPRQSVQVRVPDPNSASGEKLVWMEIGEPPKPHGCVCPPGAEATCQGLACPRREWRMP